MVYCHNLYLNKKPPDNCGPGRGGRHWIWRDWEDYAGWLVARLLLCQEIWEEMEIGYEMVGWETVSGGLGRD